MRQIRGVVVLALAASMSGCGYNQIQGKEERVEELKSNIGVELTNRNQLIPNMVSTVKGAADFERGTYTGVAQARAGLQQAEAGLRGAQQQVSNAVQQRDPQAMANADAQASQSIGRYLSIAVEAYPQLRATENFRALQDQLAESENRISVARRDYNGAVREYNTYIRQFPQVMTARVLGAERKEPYQPPAGSDQTPTVDFSKP